MPATSQAVTRGVSVEVNAFYVPQRSRPDEGSWFFGYHVRIKNLGAEPVQLVNRHWIITDADGQVQEVRGPGVVGKQPRLGPGDAFEYTSACPLTTSFGTMHGSYEILTAAGDTFDAEIAAFSLNEPNAIH